MEGDLKLAQALARISTNNSRSNSPARTGSPNPGADGGGGGTATADDAMKTHASMVLEKIQGFRWVLTLVFFYVDDLLLLKKKKIPVLSMDFS